MNLTAETALCNGKYVLDTQLGQGVFSTTYRATNTEAGQTVVIKTLAESLRQHSDFDQFKQQFLELAQRLSCCKHPNLVQVLDYFEDAGRPYLVMEHIPGQTLAEVIQANVLPEAKAIEYARQIGNALTALHKDGLLHRDVKPQNIIRRQNTDCVVLCEFGMTCEFAPGVMQTHANLVSAGYAALEQYSFEAHRTPATDIYALAATLYCLLTGRSPLPAAVREVLHSKGDNRLFLEDLRQSIRNLSLGVKQALWCGLELAAQRRPQTVEAWLSLLKSQEKILSKPQSTIAVPSADKAKVEPVVLPQQEAVRADVKSTPTNSQTLQTPPPEKTPTPRPAIALPSVGKPKTEAVALPQQNSVRADVKPIQTNNQASQPPTLEQNLIPQSKVARRSVAKPKTQGKPSGGAAKKSKTPKAQAVAATQLVSSAPASRSAVAKRDAVAPENLTGQSSIQLSPTDCSSDAMSGSTNRTASPTQTPKHRKLPLLALFITGAIAASAGVGFGFALRVNGPNEPGSSIFHTKQSFPPSSRWPMSEPQLRSHYRG
jgi:serine/threonine-protein kinase